jgi:hypothetical protein
MATALVAVLRRLPVCIMSGVTFGQVQAQVLDRLSASEDLLSRLHLMLACGTRYHNRRDGVWRQVYAEDLSPLQSRQIRLALETSARSLGYWQPARWGPLIEDRGSQITFSALGQGAPAAAQAAWDPDGVRRGALLAQATQRLPGFEVRVGGSTSIDVTRRGIDKAYGIRKLLAALSATTDDLLYVGGGFDDPCEDHPVLTLGVRCVPVRTRHDAVTVIRQFTQWMDGGVEHPPFRVLTGTRAPTR